MTAKSKGNSKIKGNGKIKGKNNGNTGAETSPHQGASHANHESKQPAELAALQHGGAGQTQALRKLPLEVRLRRSAVVILNTAARSAGGVRDLLLPSLLSSLPHRILALS